MDSKVFVGLLLTISCHTLSACGFNVTIHPRHARISEDPNTLTFLCSASVALTGCQFTWRDEKHSSQAVDLTQAPLSHDLVDKFLTNYTSSGRGLLAGECGVTIHLSGVKVWMVGCRVHAAQGGWRYAWADLFAHSAGLLPNTATPREVVVLPGGEASLILKASTPLDMCHLYLPGVTGQINFDKGPHSAHSKGRVRYRGAGVQIGECGVTLSNVSEANNGPARCYVRNSRSAGDDYKFVPLIVAHSPSQPTLHGYYEGVDIKATCSVSASRPAPSVTWLLGDEVIRQDSTDDSLADPKDEWVWPWSETSTTQKLSHSLRPEDDGKKLRCVVSHPALPRTLEAAKRVTYIQVPNAESYYSESKLDDVQFNRLGDSPPSSVDLPAPEDVARSRARAEEARWTEAMLLVEAAQSRARAEEARARAEESRARAAEYSVQAAQSRARAEEARALALEEARALAASEEDNTRESQMNVMMADPEEDYGNTYEQDEQDIQPSGHGDYYMRRHADLADEQPMRPHMRSILNPQ